MRRPWGGQGGFPDPYGELTTPPMDSSTYQPILHPAGRHFKTPLPGGIPPEWDDAPLPAIIPRSSFHPHGRL